MSERPSCFFQGRKTVAVDGKNRLSVPGMFLEQRDANLHGRGFYVMPGRKRGILAFYPEAEFRRLRESEPPSEALSDEAYEWRQFEYSMTELVTPDSNGRVVIPLHLLEFAGLNGENKKLTMYGAKDHLDLMLASEHEALVNRMAPHYPEYRARSYREMHSHNGDRGASE